MAQMAKSRKRKELAKANYNERVLAFDPRTEANKRLKTEGINHNQITYLTRFGKQGLVMRTSASDEGKHVHEFVCVACEKHRDDTTSPVIAQQKLNRHYTQRKAHKVAEFNWKKQAYDAKLSNEGKKITNDSMSLYDRYCIAKYDYCDVKDL
jgi:hypothetical protein